MPNHRDLRRTRGMFTPGKPKGQTESSPAGNIPSTVFHDPDEAMETVERWGMGRGRVVPLSRYQCTMEGRNTGCAGVYGTKLTPALYHSGMQRAGRTIFTFLGADSAPVFLNGVEVTADHVFVRPGNSEYFSRADHGATILSVAIPDEAFAEPFSAIQQIKPPALSLRRLRRAHRHGGDAACLIRAVSDCANCARLDLHGLHALGHCDQEIARAMRLEPIVVRARRRRLGLAPNGSDPPFGAYEMNWLALQLNLLSNVDGLVDQFREVLLHGGGQPLEPDKDTDQ